MIHGFKLTEELIRFDKKADSWEEAIKMAARGLLELNFVEQPYIDAMVESIKKQGPYIVIAPNIALPHARPEMGSKKIGFSVMLLEEPVQFGEDESSNAKLFITLSCVDSSTHLKILQEIVAVLSNPEKHDKLLIAKTKGEVLEIFN